MPSWRLVDADAVARQHKYTFYKPSTDVLWKVKPGEVVKLIFEFESDEPGAPRAERMWVKVTEVQPGLRFKGELDNDPRHIKDLVPGDLVQFEGRHVINTEHDDPENIVERYSKRCFVTNRVLDGTAPPGYLYREAPEREDDSGWRITAGDESEAYMDDPDNSSYVSLGAVLSRNDSFVHLLDTPEGCAYARDPDTETFVPVDPNS